MNKAILVGNLTKDPELKTTASGVSYANFTVACTRRFANQQGVREADFINCVAWRQQAEFVARYFTKGSRIGVEGTIQTRSYDAQDGTKRYVTEVVVDNVEFVGSRNEPWRRSTQRSSALFSTAFLKRAAGMDTVITATTATTAGTVTVLPVTGRHRRLMRRRSQRKRTARKSTRSLQKRTEKRKDNAL